MKINQRLRVYLLCLFLIIMECEANCPYEVCLCVGTTIACELKGLTNLPPLTGTNFTGLTSLNLDDNEITTLPSGGLPPGLVDISLISNPTTVIDDAAFSGSTTTLETLRLTNVRFTRIPDAFRRLTALQLFTLSECNILNWNVEAMKTIGQTMVQLYLETVGLSIWPDWMQYFPHLTELTLVGSSIYFIPNGAFDLLTNTLNNLNLYSNRLTSVPEALSKLTGLIMLSLHNNSISDLTGLPQKSKLQFLCLETNSISNASYLSQALRPFENTLNNVYIQENRLSSIPDVSFLQGVESLDLSKNRISDIYSGGVHSNLFNLDLSNNFLSAIPRIMARSSITEVILPYNSIRTISNVEFPPNTVSIELAFNLVTELTDTSLPNSSNIQFLHLNNNPLMRISPLAFSNVPFLMELNLRNTRLTRMPLALTSLTSLNVLDFTNIVGLVCTCTEKALGSWITKLSPTNVIGNCGQASIYDFFSKLSPACP